MKEREDRPAGKCPFGHGQEVQAAPPRMQQQERPAGKCPMGHGNQVKVEADPEPILGQYPERPPGKCPVGHVHRATEEQRHPPVVQSQPAFIQPPEAPKVSGGNVPQMIFTGPVFIGYPIEQAMDFMQQYNKGT